MACSEKKTTKVSPSDLVSITPSRRALEKGKVRGREYWRHLEEFAETPELDRKSTRLNSSHANISYAVFCLKKKNTQKSLKGSTTDANISRVVLHNSAITLHAVSRRVLLLCPELNHIPRPT